MAINNLLSQQNVMAKAVFISYLNKIKTYKTGRTIYQRIYGIEKSIFVYVSCQCTV